MIKFMRLLNFEWNRISRFILGLLIFVFVVQLGTVIYVVSDYKRHIINNNVRAGMTPTEIINEYGGFSSLQFIYEPFFFLPIGVGIASVFFYIFFIWYRDWLGKNTFIYRLLMLPISRMNIYFAKLSTILLATLLLALMQYVFLHIYKVVVTLMLPAIYREMLSPILTIKLTALTGFLPTEILLFIFAYLVGTLAVMILFTFILLERSYKLVGMIIGALYIFLVLSVIFGSFMGQLLLFNDFYLYPGELVIAYIVLWAILMIVTFFWNKKLITKKITV